MRIRFHPFGVLLLFSFLLTACQAVQQAQQTITVAVIADKQSQNVTVPKDTTVSDALKQAGITLGSLDRIDPSGDTQVITPILIRVTRVREEITVEEKTIPYDHQTVKNESLPEGETRLIQPGVNGQEKVTTKQVYEDNQKTDNVVMDRTVITEAVPEIMMVGIQNPFTTIDIAGRLAYLNGGNAWVIDGDTSSRLLLVSTADLDGRIFSLSPDGNWLLFTRKPKNDEKGMINTLWVIKVSDSAKPIDLQVKNVVRYAGWVPNSEMTVAYSTVEPKDFAPGWQANNDLYTRGFTSGGVVNKPNKILDVNSGGVYGWWGYTFSWSADGTQIAYAGADQVGIVDVKKGTLNPLIKFTPYSTHGDWAWVPEIHWSPDGQFVITTIHGLNFTDQADESSTDFSLAAVSVGGEQAYILAQKTGMFSYGKPSPQFQKKEYDISYLQSIFPNQSDTSRYRLVVMDRDGSNKQTLFPEEGATGLNPQNYAWSPVTDVQSSPDLAVVYQGNLWMVSPEDQKLYQVTGDGLTEQVDW
jgi:hypothetical protein